jgi:NAD(P)-dependent dehydrogenase (short-subunit alcohol dehydrogenase family)
MNDSVERRVGIVTGASRGIGRAIAVALARDGWTVVVNYRTDVEAATQTLAEVEATGERGLIVQADVADGADRERLVQETLSHFGRIDLLVNNAGMAPRMRADLLETSEASYDEVMSVNLKGPFFLTQLVAKAMIAQVAQECTTSAEAASRPPMIVNLGSISAYTSSTNRAEYCLSKAGINMMTRLFADRLAEFGLNVYEIRPGIIETDMTRAARGKYDRLIAEGLTPLRRWGTPEDVGLAVAAIAAGHFPFSTGEVINVDGGFHLRRL